MKTLNEILEYKNLDVIKRYIKENPGKADHAENIFYDLIRFFWGTKKHQIDRLDKPNNRELDFIYIMDEEMRDLDQMWHIFLLYTRDYMNFCQNYFGEYLHHQPDLVPIFEKKQFDYKTNLENFLDYNYDLFGEEVLKRWFL